MRSYDRVELVVSIFLSLWRLGRAKDLQALSTARMR